MINYTENQSENKTFSQEIEGPSLGEPLAGEDARLAQTLINALVQRIEAEKLDPRGLLVYSEIKAIAKKAKIRLSNVRHDFEKQIKNAAAPEEEQRATNLDLLVVHDEPFTEKEIKEAEELLQKSNLFLEFYEDFKLTGYKAEEQLTDAGLIVLGRTLLPTSSCEYGHGKLATGKTEFYNLVAGFFPLAKSLSLTTFTEKFLFYAGGEDGKALRNFLLIYGETDMTGKKGEDTLKQQYLRQLLTENKITQGSVEPEGKGKSHKAKYSVLYGPLDVVITGVDSPNRFDPQTASRLYSRHFKHTHESIKEVLKSKAKKSVDPRVEDNTKLVAAQRKWRCAFTLLKKYDPVDPEAIQAIKIPFLPSLIFKKKRLTEQDMRSFDRLVESIRVSVLLHQANRDLNDGILDATWTDYTNIQKSYLTSVPASQGLGNDLIDKFLELLIWWQRPENVGTKKTRREIYRALNVNENTGKKWIYPWVSAELLEDVTESDKKNAKKVYQPAPNAKAIAIQMQEDEELGIKDIVPPENQRPPDFESENLGAWFDSGWSEPGETSPNQSEPITDQLVSSGVTGHEQTGVGQSQLRPAKTLVNAVVEATDVSRSSCRTESSYVHGECTAETLDDLFAESDDTRLPF